MSQIFPVADRIGEIETSNLLGERAAGRHVDKGRSGKSAPSGSVAAHRVVAIVRAGALQRERRRAATKLPPPACD
jgi:hypothetical protein